jgi:hypothetical protein
MPELPPLLLCSLYPPTAGVSRDWFLTLNAVLVRCFFVYKRSLQTVHVSDR